MMDDCALEVEAAHLGFRDFYEAARRAHSDDEKGGVGEDDEDQDAKSDGSWDYGKRKKKHGI